MLLYPLKKKFGDVTGQGVLDWSQLNTERLALSHGLDVRVDKKWFFKKWALNAYIDIQNIYNFQSAAPPYLDVERDADGTPITDPSNPDAYLTKEVQSVAGTVLPSIGLMIDFKMKILLTGATGYIGKRLLPVLLASDHEVYCCVRDRARFHPPKA